MPMPTITGMVRMVAGARSVTVSVTVAAVARSVPVPAVADAAPVVVTGAVGVRRLPASPQVHGVGPGGVYPCALPPSLPLPLPQSRRVRPNHLYPLPLPLHLPLPVPVPVALRKGLCRGLCCCCCGNV